MPVAAPLIAAGVTAGGSIIGSDLSANAQQDAATKQANLYNQYLTKYGQGQTDYLKYLAGLGPLTSTYGSSGTSTTTPFVTPQFSPLVGTVQNILQKRLTGPSSLPAGYATTGLEAINRSAAGAEQAVRNLAARRGASGVQVAGLSSPIEAQRAGQAASFQANLPLQERELQTQDVGLASQLASMFGRGQTTASRTSGFMTAPPPVAPYQAFLPAGPNQSGDLGLSGAGQGMTSLSQLLAYLMGQGWFGKPKFGGNTTTTGGPVDVPFTPTAPGTGSGDLFE